MKKFKTTVDMRSKKSMIDFLESHYRYNTMNSWNRGTSYANKVKLYDLGLGKLEEKCFEIIETDDFWNDANELIHEFGENHNWLWQAGFNGRSGGYIVLYQGEATVSEYKSYCTACGQKNFRSVDENGCRCGACGREKRVDYKVRPMTVKVFPGRGTDEADDFDEWDIQSLRNRVQLVMEFDQLSDDILALLVDYANDTEVVDEIVLVPETIKKLKIKH